MFVTHSVSLLIVYKQTERNILRNLFTKPRRLQLKILFLKEYVFNFNKVTDNSFSVKSTPSNQKCVYIILYIYYFFCILN